jgi:hypothetical protein
MITDRNLHSARLNPSLGGDQRFYDLGNGYGLSVINSPKAHFNPFAWEIAVIKLIDGKVDRIAYDTPLTNDVEVFYTDDEANTFIERAIAWGEGK